MLNITLTINYIEVYLLTKLFYINIKTSFYDGICVIYNTQIASYRELR